MLALTWPDGRERTAAAREGDTVLEATEAAGIALPFGCRTGACATCAGRLLDGTVEHREPPRALKPRHRATGYVLTCIARPRSDCRLAVGAAVRSALVANPWR